MIFDAFSLVRHARSTVFGMAAFAVCCGGLTSCDTATGQGAGIGAASGAIIGGLTGSGRNAAAGAAAGAVVGALIGSTVDAREYGPRGNYPFGTPSGQAGFVVSPYAPYYEIDTRGIPHGALVRDPSCGRIFVKP